MSHNERGFTLLEIAIVLIILGYLLKQFVVPYGANFQQKKRDQTLARLESVQQALDGFAIARRRLPCPATEFSNGVALPRCNSAQAVGYVPAVTLGLHGRLDDSGRLLDSWGRPIVYAVSGSDHPTQGTQGAPDFTTEGEMARVGLSHLRSDIIVCSEIAGGQCSRNKVRANQLPYVLVSYGADASASGQQAHNQNRDALFVARAFAKSDSNSKGFDDIVVWTSESRLIYTLVRAGALP